MTTDKEMHPFSFNPQEMTWAEAMISCVHCPTGQSNEFGSILLPFKRQGMLKGQMLFD